MRKNLMLRLAGLLAVVAVLSARVALARCLDEGDDCRPPATVTPAKALIVLDGAPDTPAPAVGAGMSTDIPAPPATDAPAGYPGAAASPTSPPSPTPCALDWGQPFSPEALITLTSCFHAQARAGRPLAEICPPAGSAWWPYIVMITGGNRVCPQP
ncbi:MAG: hypothetical protein IT318_24735 [Anaerolineales bacterium]|nr:hypothetical protein [Anaerolineales bacterium]